MNDDMIWFAAGILIGMALMYFMIGRLSNRRVFEAEQRTREQLDHAQRDALEADRAHNDTKKMLIDSERTRTALQERITSLEEERTRDRAALEAKKAELVVARAAASATVASAPGLSERPAAFAAAPDDADSAGEEDQPPPAGEAGGIEAILSAAFLDKGPADGRVHGALSPMAMAREALAREAEALRRGEPLDSPPERADPAPRAPSVDARPEDPKAALKRVEAKLAMLPAGSSASIALRAERDRLASLARSAPAAASAPSPAVRGPSIQAAAEVIAAAGGLADDPSAPWRIKELEAKIATLPAGSSARAGLLAERDRMVAERLAGEQARAAAASRPVRPAEPEAIRAGSRPDDASSPSSATLATTASPAATTKSGVVTTKLLLATPPSDRAPDDLKRIKGIGNVLEGRLHAFGIYHFEQVAAMTPEEVARVNAALDFPGRIERDKWIEQARAIVAARRA